MIHSGAVVGAGLPQVRLLGWEGESLPVVSQAGASVSQSGRTSIGSTLAWLWSLTSVWVDVKTMWPVSWERG